MDLQEAAGKHEIRRDRDVVEEIKAYYIGDLVLRWAMTKPASSLFMPYSEALLILPIMISPLKGRKTIRRNSTTHFQNRCAKHPGVSNYH